MSYIRMPRLEVFENLGNKRMVHLKRKPCGQINIIEILSDKTFGRRFVFKSMDEVNLPDDVNDFVINYETEIEVEDLGNNCFKIKE